MASPSEGLPTWGTTDITETVDGKTYANKIEPPPEVKDSGIKYQEPMARAWFNYQFNLIRKWIEHLDVVTTGGTVQLGWFDYIDTTYTAASPLSVSAGSTVAIPNNAGTIISTGAPTNGDTFWDQTKITASNEGDAFTLGLNFKATSGTADSEFAVKLDSGSIIAEDTRLMLRGAVAHDFTITFPFYVDTAFATNGGIPKFEAITGAISIYDISFFIQRTYYRAP